MKKIIKYVIILVVIITVIRLLLVSEIYFNQGKELKLIEIDETHYKAKIGIRGIDLRIEKDSLNNYHIEVSKFPDFSFGDGLYHFGNTVGYETRFSLQQNNIYEIKHKYEVYVFKFLIIIRKIWIVDFKFLLNEENIEKSILTYKLEPKDS